MWLKEWCLCVSALFLLWGSFRFLGQRVKQQLIALCLGFLLLWSYVDSKYPGTAHATAHNRIHWSVFVFIGLASLTDSGGLLPLPPDPALFGRGAADHRFFLLGSVSGRVSPL